MKGTQQVPLKKRIVNVVMGIKEAHSGEITG
jgi:hypothetical protein